MDKTLQEKEFDKIFNSSTIKKNLITSSLYLTAFELLKNSIEKRLKDFYCFREQMDENFEYETNQKYRDEILNRKIPELNNNKNVYYSSCLWLKENNIITEDDVLELQKIRLHRNKIGHELPKLMLDGQHDIDVELFKLIKKYHSKIERWWIINVEMTVNPEYDNLDTEKLDVNEVKSGNMVLLDHLIEAISEDINLEND